MGTREAIKLRNHNDPLDNRILVHVRLLRLVQQGDALADGIGNGHPCASLLANLTRHEPWRSVRGLGDLMPKKNYNKTTISLDRYHELWQDKQRLDWLETQLCWIRETPDLSPSAGYNAGRGYLMSVRQACDLGRKVH